MTEQFDRAYYQRFYVDPRTAVTNRAEMNARGRLIAAMADHIGLPVRSILDAGCGVGLLRAPLRRALANLARACRGLLYFGVLTREDWEQNCDQSRTDPAVSLRRGAWYRRELARNFRQLGAGFWLRRGCAITMWEMDTAGGK